MAQDAVNKVISAEKEAMERIRDARERAKQIISDAEKEGRELLIKAEADAVQKVRELLDEASAAAELASKAVLASCKDESEKLEALAQGRMDKAAAVIAERVVKG